MKFNNIQIVINGFVAIFCIFGLVTDLEAASPSFKPAPLRNQALMFEMSSSGSRQIKLDVNLKKRVAVQKQFSAKKQLPAKKQLFVKKQHLVNKQDLVKKQPAIRKLP